MYAPHTANDFTNSGVIDYRAGVSFSGMLQHEAPILDSQYCVNLNRSGHTVNMNISQRGQELVAQFSSQRVASSMPIYPPYTASTETIHDVALRVASQLCTQAQSNKTNVEHENLTLEMEVKINHLSKQNTSMQAAILTPIVTPVQVTLDTSVTDQLSNGLRHHTSVLRKTQSQLLTLQEELKRVSTAALLNSEEITRVDLQTSAHAQDLQRFSDYTVTHAEQLSVMDVGLVNLKDELRRLSAEVQKHGASATGTKASVKKALLNHRDQIRQLKQTPKTLEGELIRVQSQIDLLHEGLMNHKKLLSQPAEPNRLAGSLHKSDLDSFMRMKQGR